MSGVRGADRARAQSGPGALCRLREDRGSAVAEFPLVAVLVIVIALAVVQAAVVLHTRNTLTDAAVQGAHHASLIGAAPADGAERTEDLIVQRLGPGFDAQVEAEQAADGTITVHVRATLPLVGLFGPAATLRAQGRAVDEESW